MSKKYPVFGNDSKPKEKNKKHTFKKCAVCGKSPAAPRTVEVNWFRGDDLVAKICIDHWNDMESILKVAKA